MSEQPLKGVMVGGPADGLIVPLPFIPERLTVVIEEPRDATGLEPPAYAEGYVVSGGSYPKPVLGRPAVYVRRTMVGYPEHTRIRTYVPEEYS